MTKKSNTTVRLFGNLHTLRRERGLPPVAEVWLPEEGVTAMDLANSLDLRLIALRGCFATISLTVLTIASIPATKWLSFPPAYRVRTVSCSVSTPPEKDISPLRTEALLLIGDHCILHTFFLTFESA